MQILLFDTIINTSFVHLHNNSAFLGYIRIFLPEGKIRAQKTKKSLEFFRLI